MQEGKKDARREEGFREVRKILLNSFCSSEQKGKRDRRRRKN
jgi:hypothetical protein